MDMLNYLKSNFSINEKPNNYTPLHNDIENQTKNDIITTEDESLDILSRTIKNLKGIAYGISDEADKHNQIINEIGDNVDKENHKIVDATKRVKKIKTKSSTKGLWLIICVLFLVLIGVSIVAVNS